jgi:hypothetical protein
MNFMPFKSDRYNLTISDIEAKIARASKHEKEAPAKGTR